MNMLKFTVNSSQEALKSFNGQQCSLDADAIVTGASGKTKLYNLNAGGALFLADNEVNPPFVAPKARAL